MKRPSDTSKEISSAYNFTEYFSNIINGRKAVLRKEKSVIRTKAKPFKDFAEFARVIAWYGRKNGASTYFKETE